MEPTRTTQPNTSASQPTTGASRTGGTEKDVDLVEDAKGLAGKVADEARGLVGGQVSQQKERSAGAIHKVADALRDTNLSDTVAGPYAEKAASFLDRMSGSVRNASLSDTMRTVESFARREPLLFLGGAFAIGLVAARFLKSSATSDDNDQQRMLPPGNAMGSMGSNRGMTGSSGNMGATASSGGIGGSGSSGSVGRGAGQRTGSMTGSTSGSTTGSAGGSPSGRPARGTGPQGPQGTQGSQGSQGKRGGDGID